MVAVDDLSLDIDKGELFCLLGASGCGKTTLLRMLAGFESVDSGSIEIDGIDMSRVPPATRPVNIMFQNYALFPHMTVDSNIAYGLKRAGLPRAEIESRVTELLRLVRLSGLGGRKPHQLSGGQRQRIAIARAILRDPGLLLLDEATSALDARSEAAVQAALERLMRDRTSIVIAHRLATVVRADRILLMDGGRITATGTHEQLINESALYRHLADLQFSTPQSGTQGAPLN